MWFPLRLPTENEIYTLIHVNMTYPGPWDLEEDTEKNEWDPKTEDP